MSLLSQIGKWISSAEIGRRLLSCETRSLIDTFAPISRSKKRRIINICVLSQLEMRPEVETPMCL